MFTIRVMFVLRKSCAAPTLLRTSATVSWRSQREAAIRERDESDRVLSLLGVWTHVHFVHCGLQPCDDGAGVFLKMTSADVCLRTDCRCEKKNTEKAEATDQLRVDG